jgi:hypothetical protein
VTAFEVRAFLDLIIRLLGITGQQNNQQKIVDQQSFRFDQGAWCTISGFTKSYQKRKLGVVFMNLTRS